jgi:predicted nucleic acid-binding protein
MITTDRFVLLDNTVLTNFALAGQENLLLRLWPGVARTTTAAFGEYRAGVAAGILPADAWRDLIQITLTEEEDAFAAHLTARLGAGERSCIAVAHSRSGALASDDLPARQWAREHDIEVTGTVGILLACVRRGYLDSDQANALLTAMIAAGYRSPVASLDALLI